MRKNLPIVLLLVLLCICSSCSGASQSVSDGAADVDLTLLSSTMVYAEVNNMMTVPDDYVGKTVRMNGQFALYQGTDEQGNTIPGLEYYACVIADATACCQQGMEFILGGGQTYPEDYPEIGADITVVGEFQTYMEGPYMYCHLIDARWEK